MLKHLGRLVFSLVIAAHAVARGADGEAAWTADGGSWVFGDDGCVQSNPAGFALAVRTDNAYGDVSLQVRFRVKDEGNGVRAAGLLLHSRDSMRTYRVHYDTLNDQVILARGGPDGERRELTRKRGIPLETGRTYEARADIVGTAITVYLDGNPVLQADDDGLAAGYCGVYTSQGAAEFHDFRVTGTAAVPPDWRVIMDHAVPREQPAAIVEEPFVIRQEEGRYIGWPTVCARKNGEILAIFSGDRDAHVCPWGKVLLVRSRDDGATWSPAETVCNTLLDDRDAGIIERRDGSLVMAWFTSLAFEDSARAALKRGPSETMTQWLRHAEKLTPEARAEGLGYFTRRSDDGGKTWEPPVRTAGSAPHGPIELRDGRLLYVGRRNPHKDTELTVEESRDGARSWQTIATIPAGPGDDINRFHEPHVAECEDGRLVALFRYHFHDPQSGAFDGTRSFLRQSVSEDGGRSWTPTAVTPMLGYPPHLLRLRNGVLVCVYGRRVPPYGEYACVSRDGGRTWDTANEIKLAGAANGDLGYPASAELADGTLLTVYYQVYRPGEKTCLMGTRWRLREPSLGQQQ